MRQTTRAAFWFVVLLLAVGADAQERTVRADDEVVSEIVRMLDAGVSGKVILGWLDREGRAPASLSPDDIIALTEAGAPPELMDRLLRKPRPDHNSLPPTRERRATPPVAPPMAATVPLEVSVHYRPYRDPEADEDEQWHLFVYFDGKPLLWSDGKRWLSRSKRNRVASILVPPGTHVIRLLQERHQRRGDGWWNEARACPEAVTLELRAGEPRVEVEIKEPAGLGFGMKGSFGWTLLEAGEVVEEDALTGPPDRWPPLCEEIESNYAEGERIPRRTRKKLDRCMAWADLWRGAGRVPDRATVRAQLERYGFRPIAASE